MVGMAIWLFEVLVEVFRNGSQSACIGVHHIDCQYVSKKPKHSLVSNRQLDIACESGLPVPGATNVALCLICF